MQFNSNQNSKHKHISKILIDKKKPEKERERAKIFQIHPQNQQTTMELNAQ